MSEFCFAAVSPDGMIEKRSLFGTERGVKVNLMFLAGIPVRDSWSDERIAETWDRLFVPIGFKIKKFELVEVK